MNTGNPHTTTRTESSTRTSSSTTSTHTSSSVNVDQGRHRGESWAGSWCPTPTGRCRGWSVRPGKASWPRCLPDGTARACGGSGTPGDGKSWHPGTNPWKRLPRASWRPGRARRTCCTSPGKAGRPRLLRRRMPSSPSRKRAAGASGMPISGRCWLWCTGKYGGFQRRNRLCGQCPGQIRGHRYPGPGAVCRPL